MDAIDVWLVVSLLAYSPTIERVCITLARNTLHIASHLFADLHKPTNNNASNEQQQCLPTTKRPMRIIKIIMPRELQHTKKRKQQQHMH